MSQISDEQVHAFLREQYEPVTAAAISGALGGSAQAIGHNLRRLGKQRLVVCVGHRADNHGRQALWVAA